MHYKLTWKIVILFEIWEMFLADFCDNLHLPKWLLATPFHGLKYLGNITLAICYYFFTFLRGAPQVDNLNAKCKPFSAVACLAKMGSICRLGVYNIIQKSFKLVTCRGGKRNCYDNLKEVTMLYIHYYGCKL